MMRPTVLPVLAVMVAGCAATDAVPADPTGEIQAVLDSGAAAWNRGALDAFVATYAPEPTTTFVAGGDVQHGFDWIRGNYAPRFEPGVARDSLRFEGLETRALGPRYALATAHYVLFRADTVTDTGVFTLVLRRDGDGWVMIHDHTSR